jgi:type VI protein secretion system component VasF
MGELDETINEAIERSHEGHGHPGGGGPTLGSYTLNAIVAISVAVTATFSALCHVKDENISEKMQHVQAQSVDAWAYYQAKGTKLNVAEAALDTMRLQRDLTPTLTSESRTILDRKLAEYADKIRHYGVEREEIKRNAEQLEATYDRLEARDDQFDLAEAAASVAIALLGISALTQRRRLLFVAWAFAGIALVVGLAGFAGLGLHVDLVARALR